MIDSAFIYFKDYCKEKEGLGLLYPSDPCKDLLVLRRLFGHKDPTFSKLTKLQPKLRTIEITD